MSVALEGLVRASRLQMNGKQMQGRRRAGPGVGDGRQDEMDAPGERVPATSQGPEILLAEGPQPQAPSQILAHCEPRPLHQAPVVVAAAGLEFQGRPVGDVNVIVRRWERPARRGAVFHLLKRHHIRPQPLQIAPDGGVR